MEDPYQIPTFEEWDRSVATTNTGSMGARSTVYNPATEILPDHPYFRLDHDHVNARFRDIANLVLGCIVKARPEDKKVIALQKSASALQQVVPSDTLDIAMVGQQGMGKSLAINALEHHPSLSKTSAKGGACTATAIKFRHKPGVKDFSKMFDALVQFMDDPELQEIIGEHVRRYYHYHFSGNVDPDSCDEELRAAETAKDFLYLVHNAYNDHRAEEQLTRLLTQCSIKDGTLLRMTMQKAHERISETEAAEDRTILFENEDIDKLMGHVESYIAEDPDLPSLWPIIQYVSIFLGSPLARHGVCLVDLPGLNDINQTRTASANAFKRKAGFEMIVVRSDRATTDEFVEQQLKQSIRIHGARKTILLLTRIDECLLDEASIENEIKKCATHPFPLVKRLRMDAEEDIEAIEAADGDFMQIRKLVAYQEHITTLAKLAFVQHRAKDVEEKMRYKFTNEDPDPISVFSISASMYISWMKKRHNKLPLFTPDMTGVPKLRQFLLGLCAEGNWKNYQNHAFSKMDMFLDKCYRLTENEKKDNAYVILRPRFVQQVASLQNGLQFVFDDFVLDKMAQVWPVPSEKEKRLETVADVVKNWADRVMWNTYNKVLRERGIVTNTKAKKYVEEGKTWGTINWNEEISNDTRQDMNGWKIRMNFAITGLARQLDSTVISACEAIFTSIMESPLAPELKKIAAEEWDKCQNRVFEQSKRADNMLKEAIKLTHEYATTETDIRCMVARLNRNDYEKIESTPRGTGSYGIQQADMLSAMKEPDSKDRTILDRISAAVTKNARKNLRSAFTTFLEDLIKEIELFDEHIGERVPQDYKLTPMDHKIREDIKAVIPTMEEMIAAVRSEFFSPVNAVDHPIIAEEDVSLKDEPREGGDDEPPSKRQKLEDPSLPSWAVGIEY